MLSSAPGLLAPGAAVPGSTGVLYTLVEAEPLAEAARLRGARATATVMPPVTNPCGIPISPINQVSESMPEPYVQAGVPYASSALDPWVATDVTFATWGYVMVYAPTQAEDLTFFRCVPALVLNWGSQDPFGDNSAQILFPSVTSFDVPGDGDLDWLTYGAAINLYQVQGTGIVGTLFEGQIISIEDTITQGGSSVGVTVTLVGAMFQFDWYVAKPNVSFPFSGTYDSSGNPIFAEDVGLAIYWALTMAQLSAPYYNPNPPAQFQNYWDNAGPIPINFLNYQLTGILTAQEANWEQLLTGYVQTLLSQAQNLDGTEWTILLNRPRSPYMALRDFSTVSWTVSVGAHGIAHDLTQDVSQTCTVVYGQGTVTTTIQGVTVTASWANEKFPDTGAYTDVYYAPLGGSTLDLFTPSTVVDPYVYDTTGAITGPNSDYDPGVMRVERYEQMGQQVTKTMGEQSAASEITRLQSPFWTGTITLTADPQEGSRFNIQAGQNILLQYFHGADVLFHISAVQVDWQDQSVQLTVASTPIDLMTLAAIWARDAESFGTQRTARPSLTNLNVSSSTTTFDSESGAGQVSPPVYVAANTWSVVPVPFGEYGSVALTYLQAYSGNAGSTLSPPSMVIRQAFGVVATQGPDDSLDIYSESSNGTWSVPNEIGDPSTCYSRPSIAVGDNDLCGVAAMGLDNSLYYWWELGQNLWTGPLQIGDPGTCYSAPSLCIGGEASLPSVVVQGPSNTLYVFWLPASNVWQGPLGLDTDGQLVSGPPAVAVGPNSLLQVVAWMDAGDENALYYWWQSVGGDWNGPVQLGSNGDCQGPPAIAVNSDNLPTVCCQGPDNALYVFWLDDTDTWNGPLTVGSTGEVYGSPDVGPYMTINPATDLPTIVAEGPSDSCYFYQQKPDSLWFGPQGVSGADTCYGAAVAVGPAGYSRIAVLGADESLDIWAQGSDGNWYGPTPIGFAEVAAEYAVGVFSGPVSAEVLTGVFGAVSAGVGGPLNDDSEGNDPWNDFAITGANGQPGLDSLGLLYGAGGPGTGAACGYYPSDPSSSNPTLTGAYLDSSTWTYAPVPSNIPYLWVALFATTDCYIGGTFYAAPMGQS